MKQCALRNEGHWSRNFQRLRVLLADRGPEHSLYQTSQLIFVRSKDRKDGGGLDGACHHRR